jgi:hypothetical protein
MTYETTTQAKLAERYSVTAPFMRKTLVDKGLVDPVTKRPTKIGHVVGGAVFVERRVNDEPQRWPAWHIETMDGILPALAAGIGAPSFVFKDRFKAMDALGVAGREICDCFTRRQIDADRDLQWLEDSPGHGSLLSMDDAKSRREWCRTFLVPLRDRIHARLRKSKSPMRHQAMMGIARMAGVISWLSGTKPEPVDIGDPYPDHILSIASLDAADGGHAVRVSDDDLKVLLGGWIFEDGGDSDDEIVAYEAIVEPLVEPNAGRLPGNTMGEMVCFSRTETGLHLVMLHLHPNKEDWATTSWPVTVESGMMTIAHRTSMTARLPIVDGMARIEDVEGDATVVDRGFALVPRN